MKKVIISLMLSASMFTMGCNNTKIEKPKSLNEAYFSIIEKLDKNEEIKESYINELLSGYEKENSSDENKNDYGTEPHVFRNANEMLTIASTTESDEKSTAIFYQVNRENDEIQLAYAPADDGSINNSEEFFINAVVSDKSLYEEISKITDIKDGKLLDQYNEIAEDFLMVKDITINDIKAKINIEPNEDSETSEGMTYYSFNDGAEVLGAYCKDGQDKVSKVSYGNNDQLQNNKQLLKNVIDKDMLENGTVAVGNVTASCDSMKKQKEMMDILNKLK